MTKIPIAVYKFLFKGVFRMNKSKKKLFKLSAFACVLSLLVGSFAFFTDRLTQDTIAVAGNIDLIWEDTSVKGNSNNEFAIDDVWDNKALVSEGNIINPGDYFDLSYTLGNAGSKSIDVRQQLILTSSEELTENAEEYKLTITGGNNAAAVTGTLSADKKSITYDLADIILNGSKESETGAVTGAYTVRLDFSEEALNAFMDSTVAVNLYATAQQHRNTVESVFPAFTALAGVTNGTDPLTLGGKVVEYIGEGASAPASPSTVHNGIIPEGGTYYAGVQYYGLGDYSTASATYTAGDEFPATVNDGDVYVYGDYEYRYGCAWDTGNEEWFKSRKNADSWGVRVLDANKTEYGVILSEINGILVTSLECTFAYTSITTAPVIPSSITTMYATFEGTSLTGEVEINATSLTNYEYCLYDTTQPIVLTGTCPQLADIAAEYDNVTVK